MSPDRNVDEAYEALRRDGRNTVENLVRWMKDAKILEAAHATEEETYKMFAETDRQTKVTRQEFQRVLSEFQKEHKQSVNEMLKMLEKETATFMSAVDSAAKAFVQTLETERRREEMRRNAPEAINCAIL